MHLAMVRNLGIKRIALCSFGNYVGCGTAGEAAMSLVTPTTSLWSPFLGYPRVCWVKYQKALHFLIHLLYYVGWIYVNRMLIIKLFSPSSSRLVVKAPPLLEWIFLSKRFFAFISHGNILGACFIVPFWPKVKSDQPLPIINAWLLEVQNFLSLSDLRYDLP